MVNPLGKFHYHPTICSKVTAVTVGRAIRQMDGFNLYSKGTRINMVIPPGKFHYYPTIGSKVIGVTMGWTFTQADRQTHG
jgi:hypothetical protein